MRITARQLAQALADSERGLPRDRKTILQGVSESEIRVRGVVDFEKWAAALNELVFRLRVVD